MTCQLYPTTIKNYEVVNSNRINPLSDQEHNKIHLFNIIIKLKHSSVGIGQSLKIYRPHYKQQNFSYHSLIVITYQIVFKYGMNIFFDCRIDLYAVLQVQKL